jgi:NADP-dependent 3-hydroxy acid dehydrogenase YdfG
LSRFIAQGSGHIINLSSVAGIKVFAPGGTVYSGTRFAVRGSRFAVRGSRFAVRVILEGLRQEIGDKIRVTSIEPGAVDSDLKFSTSGAAKETVPDFYRQAIPATSVARAIAFAIEQPGDVDIEEIVLRSTSPAFRRTEGCN